MTRLLAMQSVLALLISCAAPIDVQGHRGARGLFPENTKEGFAGALAIGVTTLEMDTGVTKDGVVVVHHDERLHVDIARRDGTWVTVPTPALKDLTFDELSRYDVGRLRPGSRYALRFPDQRGRDGVRVPRLADVIAGAEQLGVVRYNIETKLSPLEPEQTLAPEEFARAVVAVIRDSGIAERTVVQSFDWRTLRHVQAMAPEIRTSCLTVEAADDDTVGRGEPGASPWTAGIDVDDFGSTPALVHAAGCAVWSPSHRDIDAVSVAAAHELGLEVAPWTVNDEEDIARVVDWGVDAIISDYPNRVRAVLERRGLPLPPRLR